MKKLWKYLRGYELETVLAPLFKLLEVCFELLVPLVMAQIIDIGINNQDLNYVLKMGGLLVLLGLIGTTCSITAQYFAAKASVGFGTVMRNDLFAHINQLSYSKQEYMGASALITRMTSDVNQVQSGLNLALRLLLRSPFVVVGAMVMAFTVDAPTAMIFVVTIPALCIVVFGIMAISMPLYKKVQRQLENVTLTTRENLSGARVIRAFNCQKTEIHRFEEANSDLVKFQVFVGKISALMNPITYVIVNLAIIFVIWVSGKQVDTGVITQGETVALVNYMSQILVELVKLANLIVSISKALACANRISSVFEVESRLEISKDTSIYNEDKITLEQVSFAYTGAKEDSLSNINLSVKKGQMIGIIGGTGSGKTSLINLLPRFYDAREGRVLVDGKDVKSYDMETLRHKIGLVPQKATLFRGTLRENMKWGKKDATDEEIMVALEIAQATEFVEDSKEGLDMKILQGGKNLSGGQKQRLTIARALVRKPEILILDDSASALDFATDAKLRMAIAQNTDEMTVFIVSQRATTIKQADQIVVLEDGEIAGIGTHAELFNTCNVYQEICLSQLSKEEVAAHE